MKKEAGFFLAMMCVLTLKEKLAEMREKAYGQKPPEKPDISKGKGKEESL